MLHLAVRYVLRIATLGWGILMVRGPSPAPFKALTLDQPLLSREGKGTQWPFPSRKKYPPPYWHDE
ncbi:hypothetical protein D9M71_807130 [compost metagenome]